MLVTLGRTLRRPDLPTAGGRAVHDGHRALFALRDQRLDRRAMSKADELPTVF
jgi:hypothetical protein